MGMHFDLWEERGHGIPGWEETPAPWVSQRKQGKREEREKEH